MMYSSATVDVISAEFLVDSTFDEDDNKPADGGTPPQLEYLRSLTPAVASTVLVLEVASALSASAAEAPAVVDEFAEFQRNLRNHALAEGVDLDALLHAVGDVLPTARRPRTVLTDDQRQALIEAEARQK